MSDPWRNREELHQSRNLGKIVLVEIMKLINNSPKNPQYCEISLIAHLNISGFEVSPSYCFRASYRVGPGIWMEGEGRIVIQQSRVNRLFVSEQILAIPLGCKEDDTKSLPVCRSFQFYQWENRHLSQMRVKQTERRNLLDHDFR